MARKRRHFGLNDPLRHPDHRRPLSRREFIAQGFAKGGALLAGASVFSLFANPRAARAALSPDLQALLGPCGISTRRL